MVSSESTLDLQSSGSTTAIATSSATSPSSTVSTSAVANPQGVSSKSVATTTSADGQTVTVSDEAYQADGIAASARASVGSSPDEVSVLAIAGVPVNVGSPPDDLDDLLGTVIDTLLVGLAGSDADPALNSSHATVYSVVYIQEFGTSDIRNNSWSEQSYSWNWDRASIPNNFAWKVIDINADSRFSQILMGSLQIGSGIPFLAAAIAPLEVSTLPSTDGPVIIAFT